MKKIIPLLLLSSILFACAPNKEELVIPDYILPMEQMTDILTDIQLVEGVLIYKRAQGKNYNELRDYYYSYVFDKYGIDQAKFDESMSFYKENLNVLDKIYEDVLNQLEEMKRQADNAQQPN